MRAEGVPFFLWLLHLGLDLHSAAAEVLINAVGDRQHRAARRSTAQRFQHPGFGLGVEVRRNFIQQQHRRVGSGGAGDGQQLPLSLRENVRGAGGVEAFGQGADGLRQSRQLRGPADLPLCDGVIIQGDLIPDGAGDRMEPLRPIAARRCGPVRDRGSTPWIRTVPRRGAYSPSTSLNTVLFPAPVRPDRVASSPSRISIFKWCRTFCPAS